MNHKKAVKEGSLEQAEAIITAELPSLYRYACYRLGEREVAQDVIQELYLKLHQQNLSEVRNMRYYLYRALSNSCTQLLRERKRVEFVDVTSLQKLQVEELEPSKFEQEQALIAKLLATIPDEQSREEHLAAVEKGLLAQYTPQMKKLTFSQGKMLIKLIDRECEQTGYELIRTFMGSFKAGFYQTFAALFGASLKRGYYPDGEDAEIEEVIFWVEQGVL